MQEQFRHTRKPKYAAAVASLLLIAVFFSWAIVEASLRENSLGARVFAVLDRPLFGSGQSGVSLLILIKAAVFLALLIAVASHLRVFVGTALTRGTGIEPGQRYAIERVSGHLIVLLGSVLGLQLAGLDLSSLAVIGGAFGLGIGLGLQQAANNFLAGIILLVERPIKLGDRVELGNLNGDVERIGSRATWVRTNDNITVIVPNSELVMSQVINWTATDRQVRFHVPVGVSYKASPAEVRDVLLDVARRSPDVLENPEPDVLFEGFGDSSLNFVLRVWTKSRVRTPGILRSGLYFAIFDEFARRGIEIPFPQRDLHLRSSAAAIRLEPVDDSGKPAQR